MVCVFFGSVLVALVCGCAAWCVWGLGVCAAGVFGVIVSVGGGRVGVV